MAARLRLCLYCRHKYPARYQEDVEVSREVIVNHVVTRLTANNLGNTTC